MDTFTSCRGPCEQGRRLCPCPSACQRMADKPAPRALTAGAWMLVAIAAGLAFFTIIIVSLWSAT